ncbi:LysE family transporter [Marivita sp. XM-24bin2]|jgi:threonine/homoserine/homoserine lactone efflux protein|uniref:LysE family translocator n=1 Tax=unclassified Marivita TaxID=2632480 RepID=UPI000D7B3BED|nr:LysE family transporter [Marivita sp. XM-24bin2]MCR9107992.1 LysE family translocator [Paracoccaceae bacterium]PWL34582.1 MAG: lysine transporter LysE [Marivita sp. XM-24bin2]
MTTAQLIAFNLTLLAAMAAPGPALLYALRQSVAGGFVAGVATGAGLGLMAALWTGAALLGLNAVFAVVPWGYVALKTAGALYLLWIAIQLWRSAHQPVSDSAHPGTRAFMGGLLVNLANPKSVLFAGAVLVVIFPPDLSLGAKALIVANHFVVELVVYTLFAACLSSAPARAGYLRLKPIIDRTAAVILGALGLRLLFGR